MSKIILIRHGKTYANENWIYCGQTDIPLSENGRALIEEKREMGLYPDIEGMNIVTSGMKRAEETLGLIYGAVEHLIDERVKEINFGDFEGKTYEQMKEDPEFLYWLDHKETHRPPRGESRADMAKRVVEGFEEYAASGEDTVLVIHGGPIVYIMQHLFPEENKTYWDWHPDNGDGWILTIENGKCVEREKLGIWRDEKFAEAFAAKMKKGFRVLDDKRTGTPKQE